LTSSGCAERGYEQEEEVENRVITLPRTAAGFGMLLDETGEHY